MSMSKECIVFVATEKERIGVTVSMEQWKCKMQSEVTRRETHVLLIAPKETPVVTVVIVQCLGRGWIACFAQKDRKDAPSRPS